MTVLAWDGETLAADKMAVSSGLHRTTTKIFRLNDGGLFGGAGELSFILQMKNWLENGGEFPSDQRSENDWQTCILVKEGKVFVYERTPFPLVFEDKFYASGSGRDFAVAAMHLGKTAKEAVEIASLFCVDCGNGVDTLEP